MTKGKTEKADQVKNRQSNDNPNSALMMFVGAVIDLSWRMALVVLIPIIGGFELDKHLGTSPGLTIIGFVMAMVGTFLVLKRMLEAYGGPTVTKPKGAK